MAVQKNFVIKNGLEVDGVLISANSLLDKVGIGTDNYYSLSKLTVDGGIKAENLYLESGSGIGSIYNAKGTILQYENGFINTGIVTNLSGTAVTYTTGNITNISGSGDVDYGTGTIDTLDGTSLTFNTGSLTNLSGTAVTYTTANVTNLYIGGSLFDNNNLNGDVNQILTSTGTGVTWKTFESSSGNADTLDGLDSTQFLRSDVSDTKTGVTTFSDNAIFNSNVGIGTDIPSGASDPNNTAILNVGVVTANYYYGDGRYLDLTNNGSLPQSGIGIGTDGGVVGYGATFINFLGAGVSSTYYNVSTGIATIYIEQTIPPLGLYNIVEDTTPQLGGNLDLNSNDITGTGNINLTGIITTTEIDLNGSFYDTNDVSGTSGQVLLSVGTGVSWSDLPASGLQNVVEDTTPQLGGDLDLNSNDITGTGGISITGIITATDFNSTSDKKLKENIATIDNAVNITNQLRGVRFEWKRDGKPSYGVIAQELEEILPELVSTGDPKTVNYSGIIGVLIEAVKELSFEIEKLKNK